MCTLMSVKSFNSKCVDMSFDWPAPFSKNKIPFVDNTSLEYSIILLISSRPFFIEKRDEAGSLHFTDSFIDSSSIPIYGGILNIKSKELLAIGFSEYERIKSMLFFLHSVKFIFEKSIA